MAAEFRDGIPVIHASRFGGSVRAIVMEFQDYESDPIHPNVLKAWEDGVKFEEEALIQLGAPYEQRYENTNDFMLVLVKLKSGVQFYISASTDANLTEDWDNDGVFWPKDTFIEVKNMSDRNFSKMKTIEQLRNNFNKYWWQVQAYHYVQGKLGLPSKGFFCLRNKKNEKLRELEIPRDEVTIKEIIKKGALATKHILAGTLPDCECGFKWCKYENACRSARAGDSKSVKDSKPRKERKPKKVQERLQPSFIFNATGVTMMGRKDIIIDLATHHSTSTLKPVLEFEPDNKFDPNAIKIMIHVKKDDSWVQVGYVPAQYTEHVSELLRSEDYFTQLHQLGLNGGKPFVTILMRRES